MLRKSFAFILLIIMSCAVTFAQQTPKTDKSEKTDKIKRAYNLAFVGGGSYLGVQTREVTKDNFSKLGLIEVRGVAVEKVIKDSPAEKAGLQDGDVIVRFNGETVTSTRKLTRLIREVAVDHMASITVLRNGAEQNLNVTMGKRSFPSVYNGNFDIPKGTFDFKKLPKLEGQNRLYLGLASSRSIGVSVSSLTKQLGNYFGVESGKGLLINNVGKDSPAERAGLQAGDVIVEVDGKEIKGSFDLVRKMNEKKEGDVNLTIIRDKNRQTITVTPEKRKGNVLTLDELGKIETQIKEGLKGMPSLKTIKPISVPNINGLPVNIRSGRVIL